jgi:hypothetical protein
MEINRGSSGVIVSHPKNKLWVIKISKKKIYLEKEIHLKAFRICEESNYKFLRVPRVIEDGDFIYRRYTMERIDTSNQLFFSQMCKEELESYRDFLEELKDFYRKMMKIHIFPYDFELYKQSNNVVYMIDFDKFFFGLSYKTDFIHPVLPRNFKL